ncbi:MAG TPA: serine/threonine-protein kinase, partial [Kofleriaceae bacterium]
MDQLGAGGMGVVYVGHHEALGRPVVMKVLQPELCSDAGRVQRLFDEARAVTAVRSPGIVQMFDFGVTPDHRAYFVMELLEGESLAARLQQRRLDHAACCRLGRQVANVLQAAHAADIIHGDLKPANLFLVPDPEIVGGERVKVLDFGIAKLTGEARSAGARTRAGLMMRTLHYMSPEQCGSASTADVRSDIYALGCIL